MCNYSDTSIALSLRCPGIDNHPRMYQIVGEKQTLRHGFFKFTELEISYKFSSQATFSIVTNTLGLKHQYQDSVLINFRPCIEGEEPINDRLCFGCPKNKYSLTNFSVCSPCNQEVMICQGGNRIAPNNSYWRYSEETDNFLKCPIPASCLKGDLSIQTANCSLGYTGNLCYSCVQTVKISENDHKTFGKTSSGVCVDCSQMRWFHILMGLAGGFAKIGLLFWAMRNQFRLISRIKKGLNRTQAGMNSIMIKMMMTYYQVIAIILQFPFESMILSSSVGGSSSEHGIITRILIALRTSSDTQTGFSWDCLLKNLQFSEISYYTPRFAVKYVTIIPPIYLVLSAFLLFIRMKAKKLGRQEYLADITTAVVIITFNQLPDIQQYTLGMLNCVNLNDVRVPEYYIANDFDVECLSPEHLHHLFFYAFPCIALYLIIAPTLIFWVLRTRHQALLLENSQTISKFGFLYYGYRDSVYFWEFLVFLRKLLLILTLIIVPPTKIQMQALTVFMIILLSYALQSYFTPYMNDAFNKLERLSLISAGLVIYSGVYLLAYTREGHSKNVGRAVLIYFLIVAFALAIFVIPWIIQYRTVVSNIINNLSLIHI
eukprot:TRINITY_DN27059_c0_g1_i1.p1 TRINITY_DN27059_c0_g1~~TRINITY_DN27059_c0_g1_i1.p1  ORF type:complete len:601 (+),score=62.95 TRINITY_DN27059_c0_g1_i1:662-2464(+)